MRLTATVMAMIILAAQGHAVAFSEPQISDLVGDWTGTSLCQVKPSPCHDESVIFRFSNPHGDKITVRADKVVDGKPVTMGSSEWTYEKSSRTLTWEMPRGTWKLVINGDTMDGKLIDSENVLFRKVHLKRS